MINSKTLVERVQLPGSEVGCRTKPGLRITNASIEALATAPCDSKVVGIRPKSD